MDYEFLRDITGVVKVQYTLWLDGEEVMIRANQLDFSGDEIEEGMSYYDEESLSLCGVEDFLQVVNAYRKFVGQS
ncbi:MAG: YacL family protein [Klebsiella michiganensis]|nr:YacL family protein [Klebsiella michiganensis]